MKCYQCSQSTHQVCRECGRPICRCCRVGSFQDNGQGQRSTIVRCQPCRSKVARSWMSVVSSDGPNAA